MLLVSCPTMFIDACDTCTCINLLNSDRYHFVYIFQLFDMLDSAKTGTLNAENLFEGLQRVDSGITREEVEAVMQKLDKDGNGEIDFDEFLVHMTTGDLLASGQGMEYSRH